MQLVMIVEDDVLARAAMARALGKLPAVEVIEASGVAEATQLIRSLAIHLVVADIELRDGTVLEVLPQLAERRVPVILVSGHVAEFAERLPSGLSIYAKPMTPAQLCDIVTAQLGCGDPRSGFALADYVQLAALGRNSVALEVSRDGEPLGAVVIARGEAWSACDGEGEGDGALIRLLADPAVTTTCAPAPRNPGPRNLNGSSQRALLEAARRLDEERAIVVPRVAAPVVAPTATATPVATFAAASTSTATATAAAPSTTTSTAGGRTVRATRPPVDIDAEFDRLYARGVEELLAKRYREAFDTLSLARAIRSTASIEANLKRLRELGVA